MQVKASYQNDGEAGEVSGVAFCGVATRGDRGHTIGRPFCVK